MRFFLLFFLMLPIIEIVLLIKIGSEIGVLATLLWLAFSFVAGVALLRLQGIATLRQARQSMAEGKVPAAALAQGLLVSVAAVLLIIPGFMSDAVALVLLFPLTRRLLIARWVKNVHTSATFRHPSGQGNIYDGEAYTVNEKPVAGAEPPVFLPHDPDSPKSPSDRS